MSTSVAMANHQHEWEDRAWSLPDLPPAVQLSGQRERLGDLADDELLEVARAARRRASWAQARELAAIAELHRRRIDAESEVDPGYRMLSAHESVTEEVAAALMLTSSAAATLVHLAERLTGPLSATGAALEAGRIDLAKARVICDTTDDLPDQATQRVEAAALEKASDQTTGQLRRRLKRIAQRLAPEVIEERKREAVRRRRLELWETPSGTADLALCDLAIEDAHAIYNKITAAAHGLKTDGDTRPLTTIRADLATRLLQGTELPDATRTLLTHTCATPAASGVAAPAGVPHETRTAAPGIGAVPTDRTSTASDRGAGGMGGVGGTGGDRCSGGAGGEVGGGYHIRSDTGGHSNGRVGAEAEVASLADIVDELLTQARGRARPADRRIAIGQAAHHIHHQLSDAREAACQGDTHTHGRPGYRPPAKMRQEVAARHTTCVFPTCNQPSHRCDLDHTVPWRPGITCRCNLAPLCRRHHRLKQRLDWQLIQIWPGLLIWVTPSGTWHIIRPDRQ
ncbi:HNH endonuclease [Actinomadura darangshiensis]|uniref:HNH endonuclease n=1 Tax=Actinomadura darangshiensis TaxID=705336 RepID=A0A4R4ZN02_9ACTN|nr:HNH endonuclease signature motif containing protein [Actinomadura darangshiensis]TDD60238.1 HNH endonuclease [Actinomadura darangshiensis]